MRIAVAIGILAGILASSVCVNDATASSTKVTVEGTAMPWLWVSGGLNTNYQFGIADGTGPAVVGSSTFEFKAGDKLKLQYLSGTVSAGSGFPAVDANGDTSYVCNNQKGSTGTYFPSFYMKHYPIYLTELVGTFADSSGAVVGKPFAIGDGPTTVTIPTGASQLQLGTNDDRFSDNAGSWVIRITGTKATNAKYTRLYAFGGSGGATPYAGLTIDKSGNLLGTTTAGGDNDSGTVFRLTPDGTESVLYSFCGTQDCSDGDTPWAGVILDNSGDMYGTTAAGGASDAGTVYKLSAGGTETVLCAFSGFTDGRSPFTGVISDKQGNLYGTTYFGGNSGCGVNSVFGCGTVFQLSPTGSLTVLHAFSGTDGANPSGGLVIDASGDLFGVAENGGNINDNCGGGLGATGCGTLYKIASGGTESTLYAFTGGNGSYPYGGLIRDKNGRLYGVASGGGNVSADCPDGCGLVYRLSSNGTQTILYPFNGGSDGSEPAAGLVADQDGNLYGTTYAGGGTGCGGTGCGAVFKVAPDTIESILYVFKGGNDGANPLAGLIMDVKGNLYGTTSTGGGTGCGGSGCGTVFELKR